MMRILFLHVVALLSLVPNLNDNVSLEYKFRPGDEYEYVQISKQNAIQNLPGMGEMKMDGRLGGTMLMKIKNVDANGSARIETQYTKLEIVTNSFLASMNMNSDGPQEEDGNKVMRSMTRKPFYFTLTKTGKVENVEGVENLYSGLSSLQLDDEVVDKTRKTLQQTINDKSVKTLLENGFISYPAKNVAAGDKWNTSSVQAVNFQMTINNTWSLRQVENGIANITAEGKIATTDKAKVNNLVNGMKSKSDLSGTQNLDGKVDVKNGWPTQVKILSDLKGTMTLLAGGFIPQDMEIPMSVNIETTYTIVKKK
jgi:hypothetical protein